MVARSSLGTVVTMAQRNGGHLIDRAVGATVDVVLPVLDEADALPVVLPKIPREYRAIVVDNGSTDGSAGLARELGACVVHEPQRGFGAACFAGLTFADAPIVAFMDCDGSLDPTELPLLVDEVVRGELDLALGARTPVSRRAWPWSARAANRILAASLLTQGVRLRDLGPMRAAGRQDLLELGILDRRFGWPLEMVTRAAAAGWRIAERPVTYRPRIGRSKVTGTIGGTLRTIRDMAAVR
jgi:glycosyltransferase involved in cell wall biosynthesis